MGPIEGRRPVEGRGPTPWQRAHAMAEGPLHGRRPTGATGPTPCEGAREGPVASTPFLLFYRFDEFYSLIGLTRSFTFENQIFNME